jgi:hypothetical protein
MLMNFLTKLTRQQRGAVRVFHLDLQWNRKDQLMYGMQKVAQENIELFMRRFTELKRVEVEVKYPDAMAGSGLVGKLGVAMGRLKRWIEEGKPGVECMVRAVGKAHNTL